MTSPQQRKGDDAERRLVAWLREHGWPYAERAYGAGRPDDTGDVDGTPGIVWECKSHNRLDLPGWLRETRIEAERARAAHGVLVVKRRGKPDPGEWYAVMTLDGIAALLAEAGWAAPDEDSTP